MVHNAPVIGRRSLVAGAGLAGAATLLATGQAHADPVVHRRQGPAGTGKASLGVPDGLDPIASAPLTGFNYTYLTMWDFTPENFANGRAWTSGGGVYTPLAGGGTLWATAALPPGAVLGDVEWYLSATNATELLGRIWVAGTPTLMKKICDGIIPGSSDPGLVRAMRLTPSTATNGPYPHGTAIALGVYTPDDASVAISGARIGYRLGAVSEVLLPTPIRMYDSRASSKIARNQTRTHSLASQVPVGATGVILNVTLTATESSGYLKVYSSAVSAPSASAINWSSTSLSLANGVQTAVSAARSLKVTCGGPSAASKTHYLLDLVGYLV